MSTPESSLSIVRDVARSVSDHVHVRTAVEADLPYIDSLQAKHQRELGFLPRAALQGYIERHIVLLGLLNGDPACYLLGRDTSRFDPLTAMIYQACVQYDARYKLLGSTLVARYIDRLPTDRQAMGLWCAQDIAANEFWESIGFVAMAARFGGAKKNRLHLFWRKALTPLLRRDQVIIPATTSGGMMMAPREVLVFEAGQDWRTVKLSDVPPPAAKSSIVVGVQPFERVESRSQTHSRPVQRPTAARHRIVAKRSARRMFSPPPGYVALIVSGQIRFFKRECVFC